MRISDWSSDVCSSDLLMRRYQMNQIMPATLLVPPFGVLSGVIFLGESLTLTLIAGGLMTIVGVGIIIIRRPKIAAPEAERPIGRESCRERVCQYVSISVGRVSLKKKS